MDIPRLVMRPRDHQYQDGFDHIPKPRQLGVITSLRGSNRPAKFSRPKGCLLYLTGVADKADAKQSKILNTLPFSGFGWACAPG